jgi:hypothetical protein
MLHDSVIAGTKVMLLAGILAGGILVLQAGAQSPAPAQSAAPAKTPGTAAAPVRKVPDRFPPQEQMYYQGVWGIDSLKVRYTESGEIVRFSYRVVDPVKAVPLNDKKVEAFLIDPRAKVKLAIPQMESVGLLRQTSTPIAGRSYWMAFSNSGRRVRPGDRVIVEIGHFHAVNLLVE